MCEDIWENISKCAKIFGQISEDVRRYFGKYQQTCNDLWENRREKNGGQISAVVQRYLGQYQQTRKDPRANISWYAKTFWQISADVWRSIVGKYQKMCKDLLWANISRYARICGKISVDMQRSFGKYHTTCEDLWANISRYAKNFCKYQNTCKDLLWADMSRSAKIFGKYQQIC